MTREEAIKLLVNATYSEKWQGNEDLTTALDMAIKALEQEPCEDATLRDIFCMGCEYKEQKPKVGHWRPIKTRPLTEKEKEYFVTDAEFIYECDLPDDGETVLITDKWGNVETDTFYRDDGCYFEDNSGEDDVVAWMPLPESYKVESDDKE